MPLIEIHYDELNPHEQRIARLAAGLHDLRPFWPRVSRIAIGWISQQFDSEGAFFGDPWQTLSPAYLAWKSRVYPGRRILQADGDLRRSATTPTRHSTPMELTLEIPPYRKVPKKRGRSGTIVVQGQIQAYGATRAQEIDPGWFQGGTGRMPARPLIADPPALALAELETAADEYVAELARAAGLV